MADDSDDWDAEDFTPAAVASKPGHATKGQAVLAAANEPDMSKFDDEDQEEPEVVDNVVKTQPKKKEVKSWQKGEQLEAALDDPIAEKERRQRLVEQADFAAAQELFRGAGAGPDLNKLLPKSVKDFEEFATALAARYISVHRESKNYKAFVKSLVKQACQSLTAADCKEVEDCVGVMRSEKTKAEIAAKAKTAPKKQLNLGKGSLTAGLDDFVYDDAGDGDDDFM